MNSNKIFIPQTIRVGFQKRTDTYTGQLGYVIYYGPDGKIRKEPSWESWRDKKIDPVEVPNAPTEGFVLNKKAGGYSTGWNHRQTYSRVYDPRGFEFEITVENLLYILENTDSIKGKGLVGEFVYGWQGGDHILIPVASPDYQEIVAYTQALTQPLGLKGKDLVPGARYATKSLDDLIYLGRYEEWDEVYGSWHSGSQDQSKWVSKGLKYFFQWVSTTKSFETLAAPGAIIRVVDPTPVPDYAARLDALFHSDRFSPIDHHTYEPLDKAEAVKALAQGGYRAMVYLDFPGRSQPRGIDLRVAYDDYHKDIPFIQKRLTLEIPGGYKTMTIPEFLADSTPLYYCRTWLANGNERYSSY